MAPGGRAPHASLTVRIAIKHVGDVGLRAGRILLGERRLSALGIVGRLPNTRTDPRLAAVSDLSAYDVLVTDATDDAADRAEEALTAGVSCVVWRDRNESLDALADTFAARGLTLLVGANLASGLAPCLAAHESARSADVLEVRYAWTEPGRPIRRGEAIPFPGPVGARWAVRRGGEGIAKQFVAPIDGEWAAAMAQVTVGTNAGVVSRTIGVSDLAPHLEALALVAGALSVGEYPFGLVEAPMRAEHYLAAALAAGLDIAAHGHTAAS